MDKKDYLKKKARKWGAEWRWAKEGTVGTFVIVSTIKIKLSKRRRLLL